MSDINVVLSGLDEFGGKLASRLFSTQGIHLSKVVSYDKWNINQDLSSVLGFDYETGMKVTGDLMQSIMDKEVDLVILNCSSESVMPLEAIEVAARNNKNCIVVSDEFDYPHMKDGSACEHLDHLAKKYNTNILATGKSTDCLLLKLMETISNTCQGVKKVNISRCMDIAHYGSKELKNQGVGVCKEEFEKLLKEGKIVGDVAVKDTVARVAEMLQIKLDSVKEIMDPAISNTFRSNDVYNVEPCMCAGNIHCAYGIRDGKNVISFECNKQVEPMCEGYDTGDFITIFGNPNMSLKFSYGSDAYLSVVSLLVNSIPHIMKCSPGFKTLLDENMCQGLSNNMANQASSKK